MTPRTDLVHDVASMLCAASLDHPLRVGIDGVDAAGKTTLADELAVALRARGRYVVRASADDFHHPRAFRMRRGVDSVEGYYHDAFDHARIVSCLLAPLGPQGSREVQTAVFDHLRDCEVDRPVERVPLDAILLFDGVFLHRPELASHFDFTLFLRVSFDAVLERAASRDVALFGSVEAVRARYLSRYVPAQERYLREVDPERRASLVVDNEAPARPIVVERSR